MAPHAGRVLLAGFALVLLAGQQGLAQLTPNAVNKPTLTYMPPQGTALLFGGYGQSGPLDESWLLTNGCWVRLRGAGPSPRATHAAAYDVGRSELVLFGGAGADNGPLGDTWIFSGGSWQQHHVPGPPARMLHRMTYDAANRRVLLFGGRHSATGPHFDDTWAWNGSTWREVTRGGPPARFESAMTYHSITNVAVIFGGNRAVTRDYAAGALGDTWVLRDSTWSEVTGTAPRARDHHAMVHHQRRGVTLLFGGFAGGMLGDTWLFDGATWREVTDANSPSPRGGVPAMTYDSDRGKVLMYGGWGDNGALRDLWEWDGSWSRAAECPRDSEH